MSLNLDARQRAMLQEMGHPLWWPESAAPVAEAAPAPVPQDSALKTAPTTDLSAPAAPADIATRAPIVEVTVPEQAASALAPATEPVPEHNPVPPAVAQRTAPQVQAMPRDFPRVRFALRAPVLLNLQDTTGRAATTAPTSPEAPAASSGPAWLVVAELPEGVPPQGKAGLLVTNMLRAMRLSDVPVYWVPLDRIAPEQEDAGDAPSYSIDALAQDTGAHMALLLGLPAARHLLGGEQPFASLRQQVHRIGNTLPAVVSYDPTHLLRTPKAKANTWADLCLALAHVGR